MRDNVEIDCSTTACLVGGLSGLLLLAISGLLMWPWFTTSSRQYNGIADNTKINLAMPGLPYGVCLVVTGHRATLPTEPTRIAKAPRHRALTTGEQSTLQPSFTSHV